MFKIIDVVGDPLRLPTNNDKLELGHIVSIETNDDGVFFVLSNSRNPFGVVAENDGYTGLLSVFCSMIIFQTDKFELDQTYNRGDLLYSNDYGIFTTRKENDNALLLGTVNDGQLKSESYIEISLI